MSLKHLNQENTAKFAEQSVTRCPMGSILVSNKYSQIVIPVFQRPYCWTQEQLKGWMNNVVQGVETFGGESYDVLSELENIEETNSDDFHSIGIGRFKKSNNNLICVDGQQRITTTTLLLAALKTSLTNLHFDENEKEEERKSLIGVTEQFLFNDVTAVKELLNKDEELPPTSIQPFVRVLPSEVDRLSFFRALLDKDHSSDNVQQVFITQTKRVFTSYLEDLLAATPSSGHLPLLSSILRSSLVWMRMMKVEVKSQINLGQWFLWLQEKSLFGFAALLANNTPGVVFDAGDLVKNMLLSVFIEKPIEDQEKIFSKKWTNPIQLPLGRKLDHFLSLFLDEKNFKDIRFQDENYQRHTSAYEKQILALIKPYMEDESEEEEEEDQKDPMHQKEKGDKYYGICLYSRFHSYYDSHLHHNESMDDLVTVHFNILDKLDSYQKDYSCNSP